MDKLLKTMYARVSAAEKAAAISAFVCGLVAHMYMFTNKLPNHDDMRYSFSYSNLVDDVMNSNSRWGQPFLSRISGIWSTPWLIGVLSLLFIALSAVLVVKLLKVKSATCAALIGCVMVTFPVTTAIFGYMMTADTYFLSLFLSCAAAYLLTKKNPVFFGISVLCFTVSLSIYQAFLPFALSLFCVYLVREMLETRDNRRVLLSFLKLALSSALGLALYLLAARLLGAVGSRLDDQKTTGLRDIFDRIALGFRDLFGYFFKDEYNVTSKYFCIAFAVLSVISVVLLLLVVRRNRLRPTHILLLALLLLAFFGAMISIYVIVSETVHSLMVYAFVMLPIAFVVILDVWTDGLAFPEKLPSRLTAIGASLLVALLCWNFAITSNHDYLRMELTFRQTYAYSVRLIERIEDTEGYTKDIPIAFIGAPSMEADNAELYAYLWGEGSLQITGSLSPDSLLAYSATDYSPYRYFLSQYLGWDHEIYRVYPPYNDNVPAAAVVAKELEVYPQANSTCVQDGVLFVRFS